MTEEMLNFKNDLQFLQVQNWCFFVRETPDKKIKVQSAAAEGELIFKNQYDFRLFVKSLNGSVSDVF